MVISLSFFIQECGTTFGTRSLRYITVNFVRAVIFVASRSAIVDHLASTKEVKGFIREEVMIIFPTTRECGIYHIFLFI